MILNHDRSNALHVWSIICIIAAIILLILSFGAIASGESFGPTLLGCGIGTLVIAPVLNGLSVLVEDAEDRMIEKYRKILEAKKSAGPSE